MALLNQALIVPGQLSKLFETLRQGQAPDKFNRQFLKDIGFLSSNHLGFIPLFKGLGFVSADGSPTNRYRELLDSTRWKKTLETAIREAYGDIFILKSKPSKSDKLMIAGKYKTTYNVSEVVAERAATTFLSLLDLADQDALHSEKTDDAPVRTATDPAPADPEVSNPEPIRHTGGKQTSLHYNIQIHLPATKDIEVYNSIFKALKEHIVE